MEKLFCSVLSQPEKQEGALRQGRMKQKDQEGVINASGITDPVSLVLLGKSSLGEGELLLRI